MTPRNLKIIIITAIISFILVSQTSLKERIFHFVLEKIEKEALEPINKDKLLAGSYRGMTQETADFPYTSWIPPKEVESYENELQGKMAGIGIFRLLKDLKSGEFSFIPIQGTPAMKGGLRYGDRIVKVDGKDVTDLSIMKLIDLLRGDVGTKIALDVRTRETIEKAASAKNAPQKEEGIKTLVVTRQILQQDIICGDCRRSDGSWNFLLEENPKIAYIRIVQFADLTVPDFNKALNQITKAGAKGLIIDFRGNPGGFLPAAVQLADFFVPNGKIIVTTKYRDGKIKGKFAASDRPKCSLPLVIIIDEESASAAEIVSACLQDHKIATIVGTRSYGKGTIQELFPLPFEQGMLRLTDASFWRPSGIPLHRFKNSKEEDQWGVHPDGDCVVAVSPLELEQSLWIRDVRGALPPEERNRALASFNREYKIIQEMIGDKNVAEIDKKKSVCHVLRSHYGISVLDPEAVERRGEKTKKEYDISLSDLFKGDTPRFDRQLDKAIDVLKKKMSSEDQPKKAEDLQSKTEDQQNKK